ncbi:MAG TPA: hypothetical protein VFQ26_08580, partial [Nitrospiraceae bacterium]|nr:hypothetical protein [Nitrospiraceae bacterium]
FSTLVTGIVSLMMSLHSLTLAKCCFGYLALKFVFALYYRALLRVICVVAMFCPVQILACEPCARPLRHHLIN